MEEKLSEQVEKLVEKFGSKAVYINYLRHNQSKLLGKNENLTSEVFDITDKVSIVVFNSNDTDFQIGVFKNNVHLHTVSFSIDDVQVV